MWKFIECFDPVRVKRNKISIRSHLEQMAGSVNGRHILSDWVRMPTVHPLVTV